MALDQAFVGRGPELDALRAAINATLSGSGSVVVVEGEAGIGKTALIDEALVGALAQGISVFRAGAREMESHRPFGVVTDAFGMSLADPLPTPERSRRSWGAPSGAPPTTGRQRSSG